jgi:hypothetical protein
LAFFGFCGVEGREEDEFRFRGINGLAVEVGTEVEREAEEAFESAEVMGELPTEEREVEEEVE